jgi:hypothetical protein
MLEKDCGTPLLCKLIPGSLASPAPDCNSVLPWLDYPILPSRSAKTSTQLGVVVSSEYSLLLTLNSETYFEQLLHFPHHDRSASYER